MAFAAIGLRKIAPLGAIGNGANSVKSLWGYVIGDSAATVEGANYFNSAAAQLSVGDVIMASMGIGGTMKFKIYVVTAISSGAVTIALQSTTSG